VSDWTVQSDTTYPFEQKFTLGPGAQRDAIVAAANTLHLLVHYFGAEHFSVWVPTAEMALAFGAETGKELVARDIVAPPRSEA
jgi:hypothetical protein